jgi:hypothetical protein
LKTWKNSPEDSEREQEAKELVKFGRFLPYFVQIRDIKPLGNSDGTIDETRNIKCRSN